MEKRSKSEKKEEKEQDIKFAKDIKIRDGFKCVICGNPNNLNTHHLFPRERRDTRHNMLNGIILCILHHKFSLELSLHKNAVEFLFWVKRNRPEQFKFLETMCKYGI